MKHVKKNCTYLHVFWCFPNEYRYTVGCWMLIRRAGHGVGRQVHQARTWKSHGESLDKKMKFDWDLLPGCSSWLGFIKQHRITEAEQEDVMFIILASERCSRIYSGLHCLSILGMQSCSCLWTHLFTSLNIDLSSEWSKRERRNEQLVWSGGTVPQWSRGEGGEGAMKGARCNITSFLSDGLKGEQRKSV